LCTDPLLLANSFMQWTRGGVSPQQLTVSVWKRSSNEGFDLASSCAADTSNLTELIESSDDALFNRVLCNQDHILFPLLPDERDYTYNLRKRNHNRLLTIKQGRLCSCNFITRMLFKACYWLCSTSFYSRYFSLIYVYYCVIVAFCQHVLNGHAMLYYVSRPYVEPVHCRWPRVPDFAARVWNTSASEMTYIVSGGALNFTHSLTHSPVWNILSLDVRSSSSLSTFKRRLKTELFSRSFPDWNAWIFVTFVRWPRSFGLCHPNRIRSVIIIIVRKICLGLHVAGCSSISSQCTLIRVMLKLLRP